MDRKGILVVGSANMDLVVNVEQFPRPGETLMGKSFKMFPGGKGANQAVACAKLGCPTYFIGKVGNDDFGKRLTNNMKETGIYLNNLLVDPSETTGTALITVDNKGENEIIVISGSNMKVAAEDISQFKEVFQKVNIVLTQLEIPLEAVMETSKLARKNDCIFILNPAPAQTIPDSLFSSVDFFTPNEIELAELSCQSCDTIKDIEKAAKKIIDKGVKNIIVTMGDKGALFVNRETVNHFPVTAVEAVDTTGAGDAFNGALACALNMNKEIAEAIDFAHSVASVSVTRMGAQSSMPGLREIMKESI